MPNSTVRVVSRETTRVDIDIRPDAGATTSLMGRLAIAALPLTRDRLASREHVVFANQPTTPDGSIAMSTTSSDVLVALDRVPADVERILIVAFLHPKANAGKPTLADFRSLTVTVRDQNTGRELIRSDELAAEFGPVPAASVAELMRCTPEGSADVRGEDWGIAFPTDGYEAGLAGVLAQKGIRL